MRHLPGDTIAAISTALGPGAVALVRMSGDRAIEIADRVFRGQKPLATCATHTVHHGRVLNADGREVDEVLATVMCSPNTYTTEHIIEFGCHGGSVPARRVLAACLEAGARQARRGEFTERAFLGGRIDLVQAEAVADIVSAETPRGLEMALGQLSGGLSDQVAQLRAALLSMRAEIEAAIDFPEDVDAADALRALAVLSADAHSLVDRLLENQEVGAAVRDGVSVALVGKPNGIPVRLVDTAGWRETSDEAERAGVERARAAARGAALSVLVVDSSQPPDAEDAAVATSLDPRTTVVVANKSDLGRGVPAASFAALFDGACGERRAAMPAVLWASALTGEGLEELRSSLVESCLGAGHAEVACVSNVRHVEALKAVRDRLSRVDSLVRAHSPHEIVASQLADATAALGEITGETTSEEVIRHIFDRFCVGK